MPATPTGAPSPRRALVLASALLLALALPAALTPPVPVAAAPASAASATGRDAPVAVDPALRDLGAGAAVRLVLTLDDAAGATPVARLVTGSGGTVRRVLPLVGALAVTVPSAAVPALLAAPGLRAVTVDRAVHLQDATAEDSRQTPLSSPYLRVVGAHEARRQGLDGRGTTVAVLDTGIADLVQLRSRVVPVRDDLTGREERCLDLSGEGHCDDGFGHGTFMAGIVAGAPSADDPGGVAPGADVLSVKVAGRDGATDVSTVLAGIQWVVSHRERYGIDVLNLSLGTDATQSYAHDPLAYAVERAWEEGVVVVVAASNRGPAPGTVTRPGDDPFVLTVGAVDDRGTVATPDDVSPDFTARGPSLDGVVKPDVVAPGARLSSLRAPGSLLDERHPPGGEGPYRVGSGTSMATAVVSGAAALLRQAHPGATPAEIKHALMGTADPVDRGDPAAVGRGLVDVVAAVVATGTGASDPGMPRSTGRGALGDARGTLDVAVREGPLAVRLGGPTTAQLLLWDPMGFTTGDWDARTWHSTTFARLLWHDVEFVGDGWAGENWGGENWGGENWGGENWGSVEWEDGHDQPYGEPGPAPGWYGAWD